MRISDWSSDVCSSYLIGHIPALTLDFGLIAVELEQVRTDTAQHALDQLRLIIHEQGDDAHQRRHGAADGVGGIDVEATLAGLGKYQPDRIDTQFACQAGIAGTGDAAEFDPGSHPTTDRTRTRLNYRH